MQRRIVNQRKSHQIQIHQNALLPIYVQGNEKRVSPRGFAQQCLLKTQRFDGEIRSHDLVDEVKRESQ